MKELFYIIFISLINLCILIDESMNYIIDNIYLGNIDAARNITYLKEYNITTVVNCAEEFSSEYEDIKFIELKLNDDPDPESENIFPRIEIGYKFIKSHSKNNVLVHCALGVSRSATMVVFYLMKEKGWDYDTCYQYIIERRPTIAPNEGYIYQLKQYYDKYIKK